MIKRASLVLLLGLGIVNSTNAQAQMQQGYANDQPNITVDRSVLQDLKGYQPPPMFGADLMPPTTNRVGAVPEAPVEVKKAIETPRTATTPVTQAAPAPAVKAPVAATMTAPDAEALLNHPTQNFHVLTERNASMTAPAQPVDSPDGPLLPLPDDEYSAAEKAQAAKAKVASAPQKEVVKKTDKKDIKKDDKKKTDKKKEPTKKADAKKEKVAEKVTEPVKPATPIKKETAPAAGIVSSDEATKAEGITAEAPKMVKPNPNAYRPQAPQSMPAVPPIKVEKNALPPMSNSALPSLPPTTDTTEAITKPSPGVRMMDAALERQMESDNTKIKEQLASTDVPTVPLGSEKVAPSKTEPAQKKTSGTKLSEKTLVFTGADMNVSDKLKSQIKKQILPEIEKDKTSRIQIISFATAPDNSESSARRISLARSLAVRDYLKSLKIDTERIDVRALASDANSVPADKVDIVLLK